MQLLTRGEVNVTFGQHLCHIRLNNSKPKQANLNIIETVMFGSPLLQNYMATQNSIVLTAINILTVYQLKDRSVTQFELSTSISFHESFIKDYLFFSFVLGFVLFGCILFQVSLILSNFQRVNKNFLFMHFTVVQKVEGNRCCEISRHSASYQSYQTQQVFSFHSGSIAFLCGQQSPTVADDQSQSPRSDNTRFWFAHNFLLSLPFYVNKCKQTRSFEAFSLTPERQFVENER